MTIDATLDARFRDAAAAEGLLDVAYDLAESPVGTLLLAATETGLCRISFDPEPERELELLAREFGPRVLRSPRPLDIGPPRARRVLRGRATPVWPDARPPAASGLSAARSRRARPCALR